VMYADQLYVMKKTSVIWSYDFIQGELFYNLEYFHEQAKEDELYRAAISEMMGFIETYYFIHYDHGEAGMG